MHGHLTITYDGAALRDRSYSAPLSIVHPRGGKILDPAGLRLAVIRATGGGLAGGDALRTDIIATHGARVHIRTQAATVVHRMNPGTCATTSTVLTAREGSVLEYLPHPVIPGRGSALHQELTIVVDGTATVLAADTLSTGRSGEWNNARDLNLRTLVAQVEPAQPTTVADGSARPIVTGDGADGVTTARDATAQPTTARDATAQPTTADRGAGQSAMDTPVDLSLRPLFVERFSGSGELLNQRVAAGNAQCWTTVWVVVPVERRARVPELAEALRTYLRSAGQVSGKEAGLVGNPSHSQHTNPSHSQHTNPSHSQHTTLNVAEPCGATAAAPALTAGVSTLPLNAGCWVRIVGDSMDMVLDLQHRIYDLIRRRCLNAPAPRPWW